MSQRNSPDGFWRLAAVGGPDECWMWSRPTAHGYGNFRLAGECRANRVAYVLTHGPIPEGLFVLHRCDHPPCVNPAHLFLGTHAENMEDMRAKGRSPRAASVYGEAHPRAVLSDAQVVEIRGLHDQGVKAVQIAGRLGARVSTIRAIITGQNRARLFG